MSHAKDAKRAKVAVPFGPLFLRGLCGLGVKYLLNRLGSAVNKGLVSAMCLATAGFAAPPVGSVLVLTDDILAAAAAHAASSAAPNEMAGVSYSNPISNVAVEITLLRHRPVNPASVTAEKLLRCRTVPELAQMLRAAGPLEVLSHARHDLACGQSAPATFHDTEMRPSFVLYETGGVTTNLAFGLDLRAEVRVLVPATATAPPVLNISWAGSWSGSVALLATWEKYAVRAFNLARTVPGITYTKTEVDEDGFVNTGGGSDIGGFFKKKKKDPGAGKKPAPSDATPAAALPGNEPSYSAETARERIWLQGAWSGAGSPLLITRVQLSIGDKPGELYLVIQPRAAE